MPESGISGSSHPPGTGISRSGLERSRLQGKGTDPVTASSDLWHFTGVGTTGFSGDLSKTCHLLARRAKRSLAQEVSWIMPTERFFKPLTLSWAFPEGRY